MASAPILPLKGRPKHLLDQEQLQFLKSLLFTWADISSIMGVSVKTLQRRAKEWNISTFSVITDGELDTVIRSHLHDFPHAGEAMVTGHLHSLKIHVQRKRLRLSIQRVNGSASHLRPAITRRRYSVPGPNALWHVDGNHKMIRWRLVVHGCIDGFSRMVTFLRCSNNNRSETVLKSFVAATQEFGTPSRVRTDLGGENVQVWRFMEQVRGADRSSYITGSSVHNTRIERLWRDVYTAVSSMFVFIFNELEERGVLDPDNVADLFTLHYVFIPRINASLNHFQSAWNNHPLSTESNRSPLQLYTAGSIGSVLFSEDDPVNPNMHGLEFDSDDSVPDHDDDTSVVVPETNIPLSQQSMSELTSTIDPLQQCQDHGIQLYYNCLSLLHQLMQQDDLI